MCAYPPKKFPGHMVDEVELSGPPTSSQPGSIGENDSPEVDPYNLIGHERFANFFSS